MFTESLTTSSLGGVALGPLSRDAVVLVAVTQVLLRNATDERVAWVAVGEQRANGEEDLGDGECWRPVVLEDVETDGALAVDVAVVDPRSERHLSNRHAATHQSNITGIIQLFAVKYVIFTCLIFANFAFLLVSKAH